MAEMGKYCKAYLLASLRQFPGWKENLQNVKPEEAEGGMHMKRRQNGAQNEPPPPPPAPRALSDDDYLYLQENLVVTDGVFIDEHIVFDEVTPEWREFCEKVLKFEMPNEEADQTISVVQ